MAKGSLQIDVLGTSFAIQADETPEYLSSVYARYKSVVERVERSSAVKDSLKIAILAGILLADEGLKDKARDGANPPPLDLQEAERLALGMISRIDQVI
jgi:cell division protein ZapA